MSEATLNEGGDAIFEIVTTTRLVAPKGTTIEELAGGHGALILPDGTRLKTFVVFERAEEEDLTHEQMLEIGCSAEDISRDIAEA
jgi:hypothetical protein